MTTGAMPRMMRMILPFRFTVTGIDGTWKLNQNKPADVRETAATALALGNPAAQAIARLMRAHDIGSG
jgi:transcriptional regulator